MTTIVISGVLTGNTHRQVEHIIGSAYLYKKGTDDLLFSDYSNLSVLQNHLSRLSRLDGVTVKTL